MVTKGDKVRVQLPFAIKDDPWYDTKVCCVLSTQFTALVKGHTHFFFFKHKGDTWQARD